MQRGLSGFMFSFEIKYTLKYKESWKNKQRVEHDESLNRHWEWHGDVLSRRLKTSSKRHEGQSNPIARINVANVRF